MSYVHDSAIVDEGASIGEGTKIWHFSHVMGTAHIGGDCSLGQNVFVGERVRIGDRVKIQNNVSVYEGVRVEDDAFLGPSVVFTNVNRPRSEHPAGGVYEETLIGRGATIGANATIVCGATVGRYALVGAGAVVTRDVPDFAIVYGNPATQHGSACMCGTQLPAGGPTVTCADCGREYSTEGEVRPL